MKKTEEQLANELDAFLTAQLKGESPVTTDAAQSSETKLAADLLQLIEQTEPDPAFVTQLENHLKRVAHAQKQQRVKSTKRPSFRQQFDQWIKEQLIMKRTIYALGGITALIIIGFFAWNALRPQPETTSVADVGETAAVTGNATESALTEITGNSGVGTSAPATETNSEAVSNPTETANLPPLPQIQNGGGVAQGLGGGGGAAAESTALAGLPVANTSIAIDPQFMDVFSGTQFIAGTALSTDINQALVWQQSSLEMDLAEAQQIANAFGFTGPLYIIPQPMYVDEAGVQHVEEIPVTYFAFDGTQALTIDAYGTYYRDDAISFDFTEQLPLEQIAPIAEAFVQANGLADFPYVIDRIWGNEVLFYRLIDGRSVSQPEITITLNDQGQIAFAGNQKLRNLVELGNYPLRTAAEAFQLLQAGVLQNNIWYTYTPSDFEEAIPVEPFPEPFNEYRNWQRAYQPGEEAHLYTWPTVYLLADGSGAPRIEAYPFAISGSEQMMQEIAANPNQQIHFWGVVEENGRSLQLTGWEPVAGDREPIFAQGTARRDGDQMLFETDSSETYLIPNAPQDLPENEPLNIFGWALRDVGAAFPAVDWESIDVFIEYPESVAVEESAPVGEPFIYEPYVYQQVSVNGVELIYAYSYIYPEVTEGAPDMTRMAQMPTTILQPAWKFTGTAENGDQLEFVVPAVAPEYVQAP